MNTTALINEKVAGFFIGALDLGYDYDDAWSLLLNSTQGNGILNNNYRYSVHLQGRASAEKADTDIGKKYRKTSHIKPEVIKLELLSEFISMAHERFGIPYKDIFKNISLNEFMRLCGNVLGNYDDKLITTYIVDKKS